MNNNYEDINITFKQENETLKNQLDKALLLDKELEELHIKYRKLNSDFIESNQKIENFQNRLKLSTSKCNEQEKLIIDYQNKFENLLKENKNLKEEIKIQNNNIIELKNNNNNFENLFNNNNLEKEHFFDQISTISSFKINSYAQSIDIFMQFKMKNSEYLEEINLIDRKSVV